MTIPTLRLRGRIYLGFGLLLVLAAGIAAVGKVSFGNVAAQVQSLDVVSGNLVRVLQAGQILESVRRGEARYRVDPSAALVEEIRQNEQRAKTVLLGLRLGGAQASETGVAELLASIDRHDAMLSEVLAMDRKRLDARNALFSGGDALTATTGELIALSSRADSVIGAAVKEVNPLVLLVRVANWRYLATWDVKGVETFQANVDKAVFAIKTLVPDATVGERAAIGKLQARLAEYASQFGQLDAARGKSVEMFEELRLHIMEMQTRLEGMSRAMQARFDGLSAETLSTLTSTGQQQVVMAAPRCCWEWLPPT